MHDSSNANNSTAPSNKAPDGTPPETSQPPYVAALFGPEVDHPPLPPFLAELVGEVAKLAGASPPVVGAVTLAALGAVVGPNAKLQRARSKHPVGFSVIVTHEAPRTLPWFDVLQARFLGRVFDLQIELENKGAAKIKAEIAELRDVVSRIGKSLHMQEAMAAKMKGDLDRAPGRLKPYVVAASLNLKDLEHLMLESFDGGCVLVGCGGDPGADLLRLKASERAHLTELLNRSWEGAPLAFGRAVQEGHLSLLWQTRQPLQAILGRQGFDPGLLAVPTLVLHDTSPSKALPAFECEPTWTKLCNEIFNLRCYNRETTFTLSADAEAQLAGFAADLAAKHAAIPAALRPYVAWLPELAARLAMLFWIMMFSEKTVIENSAMVEAIEATRWFGRPHLLAAAAAGPSTDTVDRTDKRLVLLTKIRTKAPITRRDLRRCFDNQKVRWFDEALDALIEGGRVRYNEPGLLIACR